MSITALDDYGQFIQSKRKVSTYTGFDIAPEILPSNMFDFQRHIVSWNLRKGRSATLTECGTGKTIMQLNWAQQVVEHTNQPVLVLTPLAVAKQTKREGEKFGVDVTICRSQRDIKTGVNVANYEMLEHFDTSKFSGVVLDECFAKGTDIECFQDGSICYKHIENIRKNDIIVNAAGLDTVADIHRREVQYAVKVSVNGTHIVASPNHPFFTQRGWIGAQSLLPGDHVLEAGKAMHMVQQGVYSEMLRAESPEILRDILLSEMAHDSARSSGCGTFEGSSGQERRKSFVVAEVGQSQSESGNCAYNGFVSFAESGNSEENICPIERNEAQTFRTWWKRNRDDCSAGILDGTIERRMDSGVCLVVGETTSRLSNMLQNRHSESIEENSYRSGWFISRSKEGPGHEKGCNASILRVDGIEILKPGHPELERLRDADGKLYFYDIGATRHPSFSVNGFLVHNSSVLKNFMGKTKQSLVSAFRSTPYRLACSATPAPNDYLELGNHCDFLGVMPSNEMIMRWFINDTMEAGNYRLKKHGEKDYWNWVSSWAVAMDKPSDIGFSDDGFILPPLIYHTHVVETDCSVGAIDGELFRHVSLSATTLHKEMRITCGDRAAKMAEVIFNVDHSSQWLIWCNTNYEADELKAAIPDAIEVRGSESVQAKEEKLEAFGTGQIKRLITKCSIAGFGMNYQNCCHMGFVGMSYSQEQLYQSLRRSWRYGQKNPVHAHMIMADSEMAILQSVRRKQERQEHMKSSMIAAMRDTHLTDIDKKILKAYVPKEEMRLPLWLTK